MGKVEKKIKRLLRLYLNRVAIRFGYMRSIYIRPFSETVDFTELIEDPIEAFTRSAGRPVLMTVPIELCRGFHPMAFKISFDSSHPYIMTAHEYLINNTIDFSTSPLYSYYKYAQPKNAAELLDVPRQENLTAPEKIEPLEGELPWIDSCGPHVKKSRLQIAIGEAKQYGLFLEAGDGHQILGPISKKRGQFEIKRICNLTESIRKHGWSPASIKDHISARVLCREPGNYAYLIKGGQHRISVLAALNYDKIPVLLPGYVSYRKDVFQWPGVLAGSLSSKQAISVFDRVFEGKQPTFLKGFWPDAWYKKTK
ncbi:MAG: hypothetical protein K9J79_05470 [Desulfobacteraceae bacterium]|nr:hypothetical protein [Desulfobacteraceae bacterium]